MQYSWEELFIKIQDVQFRCTNGGVGRKSIEEILSMMQKGYGDLTETSS